MRLPAMLFALPILALAAAGSAAAEDWRVPVDRRAEPAAQSVSTASVPVAASSSSQGSFTAALNEYRARYGLRPVSPDPELTAAAQAYAREMASTGHFGHVGLDGSHASARATRAGCSWRAAAENLAWGQTSIQQVMQGWHDSPGHRRNLQGPGYARYGLGQVGTYWVLMFADQC